MTLPDRSAVLSAESIDRRVLEEGVVLLMRRHPHSRSVVVGISVASGAADDPDDRLGLAECTAEMLMRGSEKMSADVLNEEVESVGASLGAASGLHTTGLTATCLAEDFSHLLDLIEQTLTEPKFPDSELEKVKSEILTGLFERDHDTRQTAVMQVHRLAYPTDHPYSRPPDGFFDTVEAITRDDLVAHHSEHLCRRPVIVTVVGAIEPDEVEAQVRTTLGSWVAARLSAQNTPDAPPLSEVATERLVIPGKTQSDLIIGVPGPRRGDDDYLAARIGNLALGGFGLMGRLGKVVREEHGLAYYASSALNGGAGPGLWMVYAGVDPNSVDQVVGLCRSEMQRLASEPLSGEEMDDCASNFTGSLPMQLESNGGVAQTLGDMEWYGLGLDYVERYPSLIRSITADQVMETAMRYLGQPNYALAIAGPNA